MMIKSIDLSYSKDLNAFIDNMGKSADTFRYFKTRNISCLKNHIITKLVYDVNSAYPIGYAHIDQELGKNWFGICIAESFIGKGVGFELMYNVIQDYDSKFKDPLYLTVDNINMNAINLYKKMMFSIIEKRETNILMKRIKTCI